METNNLNNQFAALAATFCLVGLAMLLSVIIWHQEIDKHPWFEKGPASTSVSVVVPTPTPPSPDNAIVTATVPESVIQEIVSDPRNLTSRSVNQELSPALKFLQTLESPSIFPAQR